MEREREKWKVRFFLSLLFVRSFFSSSSFSLPKTHLLPLLLVEKALLLPEGVLPLLRRLVELLLLLLLLLSLLLLEIEVSRRRKVLRCRRRSSSCCCIREQRGRQRRHTTSRRCRRCGLGGGSQEGPKPLPAVPGARRLGERREAPAARGGVGVVVGSVAVAFVVLQLKLLRPGTAAAPAPAPAAVAPRRKLPL